MIVIKHELNQFLFQLFPSAMPDDRESIKTALEKYYSFGPYKQSIDK